MSHHDPDLRLVDAIFNAVYRQDGNTLIDTDAVWVMALTLMADVLLRASEIERERLLRGLTRELRAAMAGIQDIMKGPVYPRTPDDRYFTH